MTDVLSPSEMVAQQAQQAQIPGPSLPIPYALPPQTEDAAQPDQIAPGSFAERLLTASNQLSLKSNPNEPGAWARSIVGALPVALASGPQAQLTAQGQPTAPVPATGWKGAVGKIANVGQGLMTSLGDASAATKGEGGWLSGVEKTMQARGERLSKEETDRYLHSETQARTIALTKNAYRQDAQDRNASYAQVKGRIDSMRQDHAVQDNISQSQLTQLLKDHPDYLNTHTGGPVGEEPQLDANGKPMIDPHTKQPIMSPIYSLAEVKTKDGTDGVHKINQAEHDYLKRNGGPDLPVDTPLPTDKFLYVSTKAQGVEDARRRIEKSNDEELTSENQRQIQAELQDHSIQHYVAMVPGEPLAGLYQAQKNAADHIDAIDKQISTQQQKPGNEQAIAA